MRVVGLAMLPLAAGLLFEVPWLWLASWHAYRGSVMVVEAEEPQAPTR